MPSCSPPHGIVAEVLNIFYCLIWMSGRKHTPEWKDQRSMRTAVEVFWCYWVCFNRDVVPFWCDCAEVFRWMKLLHQAFAPGSISWLRHVCMSLFSNTETLPPSGSRWCTARAVFLTTKSCLCVTWVTTSSRGFQKTRKTGEKRVHSQFLLQIATYPLKLINHVMSHRCCQQGLIPPSLRGIKVKYF